MKPKPETPTLDRMQSPHSAWTAREGKPCRLVDHSQIIGEFIDWIEGQGIYLAKWGENDVLYPYHESIEKLLARFFNIDLEKVDEEKMRLLRWIREA